MTWAAALLAVAIFVALARALKVVDRSRETIAHVGAALRVLRDRELADDAKETLVQQHASRLLALFAQLTLATVVALAIPAAGIWLLTKFGALQSDALRALLASWQFLVAAIAVTWTCTRLTRARRP